MSIIRFTALLAAAGACVSFAGAQGSSSSCDVDAQEVLHRQNSGVASAQFRVIETEAEWCAFWAEVHSNFFPVPECDTASIDFATDVALVAAIGRRPNGCYNVDISCVKRLGQSDDLHVTALEIVPGKGCVCTQATVNPVDVVKVARPVGGVDFFNRRAQLSCN